jgi:hypothetical protein
VVKESFDRLVSAIDNWNCPALAPLVRKVTEAVIESPGETAIDEITTEPSGYISYQTKYWALPLTTSDAVPICSTEGEL